MAEEDPSAAAFAAELAKTAGQVEIDPGFSWIWNAWHRLNQDRAWRGGGMGPSLPLRISWRAVQDWCEVFGYNFDDALFMDECFEKMDKVFTDWYLERAKTK